MAAPRCAGARSGATADKIERADLLLLALAALLRRGGERVRLIGAGPGRAGRAGSERLAARLPGMHAGDGMPAEARLARHARVVLIGDLLSPLEQIQAQVARMAAVPVTGHLLQVLDPAEALLPYEGRVRFEGLACWRAGLLIPRVEGVRDAYAKRLAAQQAGLAAIAAAAGWGFATHRTDHSPEAALLALYTALSPEPGGR